MGLAYKEISTEIRKPTYWHINGNKWSKSLHSYEKALALAKTMINCTGCDDCSYCTNCTECSFCDRCVGCNECESCRDCINCNDVQNSCDSIDVRNSECCVNCVNTFSVQDAGIEELVDHAGNLYVRDEIEYIE